MNIDDVTHKFSHPTVKRCRELMEKIKRGEVLTPEEFKELQELGSKAGGRKAVATTPTIPTESEQKVLDIFSGTVLPMEEDVNWLKNP